MEASRPKNLSKLREILSSFNPRLKLLAGGTDLVVWLNKNPREDCHLVDLTAVEELKQIEVGEAFLDVGAAVTFREIEESYLVRSKAYCLSRAASMVGSGQIRNRGTIGGNIANCSPAADTPPALCALGALIVMEDWEGKERIIPAQELNPAELKSLTSRGEFIKKISIPMDNGDFSFFSKVGSRRAVTISKLNLAFVCRLKEGKVQNSRMFLGALAPWPIRALEAEEFLSSAPIKDLRKDDFLDILSKIVAETIPTRSSMPYKRQAVKGLGDDLWKGLREVLQ
ncbi:FAD binding domain-containing protein [Thermovirga lienii]|uniref:FAD binding domain-containing protein n=1 Tax=Thermovirga lienii TaxID=336261 RepID=UPI002FDF8579